MSDASSLRKTATLPSATGRNASSVRYYNNEIWYSNGTNWVGVANKVATPIRVVFNGSLADQAFFVADQAYTVTAISEVHSTAGTDGSAVNLQVVKDTGTTAPGAGVDLLTNNTNAGFNLKGTANTVQAGALTATAADLVLAAGDRLSVDFAGVLTALAGVVVTVVLTAVTDPMVTASYAVASNGSLADAAFFVADRNYKVISIREVHATAGTDGSAVSLQVTKDTSTNAPGAGVDLLTNNANAGFNMKSTINTVQVGTLSATPADLLLAAGDRLSVDFAGVLTALAGVVVTVELRAV